MKSIDKADVELTKLFNWGQEFKIKDIGGKEVLTVHIRLNGDSEISRARVYALRKSAEMRKKLNEENSDERLAYIPNKSMVEPESLVEGILLYKTREISQEAVRSIKINFPKEPGIEATLEEQETYQKEIDDFPTKRSEEIKKYITDSLDVERNKIKDLDLNALFNIYEKLVINQICENEMTTRYREMCAFFGTYKDKNYKDRLFKVLEELNNLPIEVKNQFIDSYEILEINGDDLKKLQEVTQ